MKKLIYLVVSLLLTMGVFAQNQKCFNYQAVIRDGSGGLLANKEVLLKIDIIQGELPGTICYTEEWEVETNALGLVNLKIGEGDPSSFGAIDWGGGSCFISVTCDGEHLGTSELLSVPFAMQAQTVVNDKVEDNDSDPFNEIQDISVNGRQLSISNGSTVALSRGEIQSLSISGNKISISDGNTITIPDRYKDDDDDPTNEIELPTQAAGDADKVLSADGAGNVNWTTAGVDTKLTESEVDDFVSDNGYLTAEVDGSITNEIELPAQTGNSGKILATDGTNPFWTTSANASNINGLTDAITDDRSVYLGNNSGINDDGTSNMNVGLGINALQENTSGFRNTALGNSAMLWNTTGEGNVAVGEASLAKNKTGGMNVAIGAGALLNSLESSNVAIGNESGSSLTNGTNNIFVGAGAAHNLQEGSYNVSIGRYDSNTTESHKLYIENSLGNDVPLIYGEFDNDLLTINGNLNLKDGTSAGNLSIYEASGSGTNKVTILTQAISADYSLTLPINDGDANEVLTTDGDGNLSWTAATVDTKLTETQVVDFVSDNGFVTSDILNNVSTPTNSSDAANKAYVDNQAVQQSASHKFKMDVQVVATTSLDIATPQAVLPSIDGYQLMDGDRVLLTAQGDPRQNLVWIARTNSSWELADDFDSDITDEVSVGNSVMVQKGNSYISTIWTISSHFAMGTTWSKRNDLNNYQAGSGISISDQVISADISWIESNISMDNVDHSSIDAQIDFKADKVYVDTEIALKADKVYVDTELNIKADKTYVDSQDNSMQTEIDELKKFIVPTMTTTERDALTPEVGMMIVNTTENKFQGYTSPTSPSTDGIGTIEGQATYDGPAMGQTFQPLSSGVLKSIQAKVAVRFSAGDVQIKIYDAPNGNLMATSDNTIHDSDATEFSYVSGTWTFNSANLTLSSGITYYLEFTSTNGNRLFVPTNRSNAYPRGAHYRGALGSVTTVADMDLAFILIYGETSGGWVDLH